MKWVTWEQVGIDRMGCAWLIKKFIDPEAEFAFVSANRQQPLPEGMEPFDIPGVRLSHRRGHCTFYTLLQEYNLMQDSTLARIARMIDEVDEVQEINLEAAAPGLDLICRGIRLISADDWTALVQSTPIYEALYAQLTTESV